jgi:hypothetical protein
LLLLTLCATSACGTGLTGRIKGDYCLIARPIGYDTRVDSAETVKEVEAHNSKWVCACENDCPKGVAK